MRKKKGKYAEQEHDEATHHQTAPKTMIQKKKKKTVEELKTTRINAQPNLFIILVFTPDFRLFFFVFYLFIYSFVHRGAKQPQQQYTAFCRSAEIYRIHYSSVSRFFSSSLSDFYETRERERCSRPIQIMCGRVARPALSSRHVYNLAHKFQLPMRCASENRSSIRRRCRWNAYVKVWGGGSNGQHLLFNTIYSLCL